MSIVVNKRPSERCWAGNPCNYELYSAAAASDASIYFQVRLMFRYVGEGFSEIIRMPFYPTAGTAQVDVRALVDGLLEFGLPTLSGADTDAYHAPKQTGYFYISYREISTGTPGSFDDTEVDYERLAVKGGISYTKWRGNAFWNNYADTSNPGSFPFFTWQPSGRMVGLTDRMYLAWLNYTTSPALVARVLVYYTDGTNSGDQDFTIDSPVKDKIVYIPVGAGQLGLEALNPAKTIYKWDIRVFDVYASEDSRSTTFSYYADYKKNYNDTVLHYRNSLGGIDALNIRGVIEQQLEYLNEQQAIITGYDYFNGSTVAAQQRIINNREKLVYKGDVGYMPKEEQDRLRDAHLNRELWWCVDDKWLPAMNVTGNYKQRTSTDNLWSMPFEWMLGVPGETCYTPKNVNLGDADVSSNVCAATITDITIDKTITGGSADIEFDATVTGATEFTYQVVGFHASPIVANVSDLPITVTGLTAPENYILRLRGKCSNGAIGKKVDTPFVTAEGITYNSSIYNNTDFWDEFDVYLDGVVTQPDMALNPGEFNLFNETATGTHTIKVGYGNGIPTVVNLIVDGVTYPGTVGAVETEWTGITLTDGFRIELY